MSDGILALGTYPIVNAIHGGQRRVRAIQKYYESIGIRYDYACIYEPKAYLPSDLGTHDIPCPKSHFMRQVPQIGDLRTAYECQKSLELLSWLGNLIREFRPRAIQLEQPFLGPLVLRYLQETGSSHPKIIYSSHNIESALKLDLLGKVEVEQADRQAVHDSIMSIETELCRHSSLIISCTDHDASWLRRHSGCPAIVIPNGVDRPVQSEPWMAAQIRDMFGGEPFLLCVGSSHIPNIQGFIDLLLTDGAYFLPSRHALALCGGMATEVVQSGAYGRYSAGHSRRIVPFPKLNDAMLDALKASCHGILLPILTGGGSNLKTAEAIAAGCHIVGTPKSFRGFSEYEGISGLTLADDPCSFRAAAAKALSAPALQIDRSEKDFRERVYWDAALARSDLKYNVEGLLGATHHQPAPRREWAQLRRAARSA